MLIRLLDKLRHLRRDAGVDRHLRRAFAAGQDSGGQYRRWSRMSRRRFLLHSDVHRVRWSCRRCWIWRLRPTSCTRTRRSRRLSGGCIRRLYVPRGPGRSLTLRLQVRLVSLHELPLEKPQPVCPDPHVLLELCRFRRPACLLELRDTSKVLAQRLLDGAQPFLERRHLRRV